LSYGYSDVATVTSAAAATPSADASPIAKITELVTSTAGQDHAAALLGRLDNLSDAEVESLLQQHMMDESGHG